MSTDLLLPSGTTQVVPTDDGAELAVVDLGTGPAVVLIHGWTEQRETWAPVVHRLVAAGRRVVLYDQRGHGSSTGGRDGFTIERLAGDLHAVLDATDVHDAVLAGHSMGGMTILSLATHRPEVLKERAAALALIATGASSIAGGRQGELLAKVINKPWLLRLFRSPLGPLLVRRTFGRHAPVELRRMTRDHFLGCTDDARLDFGVAMQAMDLTPCLPSIDLPTVVLSGTKDRLTPPHLSDALVASIPGARLIRFDGFGHQLQLEAADRVAEILRSLP